ncbi:MAG: M20/M25/M40 family metallo-hydrolase, partial [Acidobacteria bacterium]|nr:M20/M25/M40 family metallo-hydrolase [Acidobacteriota bacterium]
MLRVDGQRLLADLESLGRIGATPDGGVSRLAFSEEDLEGRRWFERRVEEAGLVLRSDGAGNLSAVLPVDDPGARTLLLGSHLDTVPNGGRYDGALGVLAALEVLRTVKERRLALPVHLEAISFTDEEGSLLGEFGSLALAGKLDEEALARARGGSAALEEGMARLGIDLESARAARRPPKELLAYLELHIEQGTRLESAGLDIGAVT